MADEDPFRGAFASFANVLLERALPRVREWARQRLGPRADLGQVVLEGTRVVATRARVPMGPQWILRVTKAILQPIPDALASGAVPVRLERLDGVVERIDRPQEGWRIVVSFDAQSGGPLDAWAHGTVALRGENGPSLSGQGTFTAGPSGASLETTQLAIGGGEAYARAQGAPGQRIAIQARADGARSSDVLDVAFALFGRRVPARLPFFDASRVEGVLDVEQGRVSLRVEADTERSRLHGELRVREGSIEHAELTGTLAPDELWAALDPTGSAVSIVARGRGALAWPALELAFVAPALRISQIASSMSLDAKLELREGGGASASARARLEDGELSLTAGLAPDGALSGRLEGRVPLALARRYRPLEALELRGPDLVPQGELSGRAGAPQLNLRARSSPIELRTATGSLSLDALALEASLDGGGLGARVAAGPFVLEARRAGAHPPTLALHAGDVGPGLVRDLLGLLGAPFRARDGSPLALPEDLRLGGMLLLQDRAWQGSLSARTERSSLRLSSLRWGASGLEDGLLAGSIALADVVALGLRAGPVGLLPDHALEVRGRVVREIVDQVEGPALNVSLAARRLGVEVHPAWPPLALRDASAELALRPRRIVLRRASARLFGGRLEVRGAGEGSLMQASLQNVGPGLAAWLRAATGLARLPELGLDGRWTMGDDRDSQVSLAARTPASRARVEVAIDSALAITKGSIEGELDSAELGALLTDRVALEGALALVVGLEGSLAEPRASVLVTSSRVRVERELAVEDVLVRLSLARDRQSLDEAVAAIAGGTLRAKAERARGGRAKLDASVEGVELGRLPRAGELVRGRAKASLALAYAPGSPPVGDVDAHIFDPQFLLLRRARPALARVGLPLPDPQGTAPARLRARLDARGVHVLELSAQIAAGRIEGALDLDPEGALDGRARATVRRAWLERSALLELPAALAGDVTVPLLVAGSLAEPRVRADLPALVERWLGPDVARALRRWLDRDR